MQSSTTFLFLLFAFSLLHAQAPRLVVPIGHIDEIKAVAFDPNDKFILTGGQDKNAVLWDKQGREIQSFRGHEDLVSAVAFSPDGAYVLTGSEDRSAILWDINGEKDSIKITGHAEGITAVAFSPVEEWILTGSFDKSARLWDRKGNEIRSFTGHNGGITSVAFSSDGKWVLTASRDKTAKLWDASNGDLIRTYEGHTSTVWSAVISRDRNWVLTASGDKTVRLWDITNGKKEKLSFPNHKGKVNSAVFSSDDKYVLSASDDLTAKLWSVSGKEIRTLKRHTGFVNNAVFSRDGQYILTGSQDKTAILWTFDGEPETVFTGHSSSVNAIAWAPGGKALLTGHANYTAQWWELSQREVFAFVGHEDEITSIAISAGGDSVLTASHDKTAIVWNNKGTPIQRFRHSDRISAAAFSPVNQSVFAVDGDGAVMSWDSTGISRKLLQITQSRSPQITSLSLAPDGSSFLVGGRDSWSYNLADAKLRYLVGHYAPITSVAYSPDGSTLLTGSRDRTARLWNVEGDTIITLRGHRNWVSAVAFSPPTREDTSGGEFILTGSNDNTAKLWNYTGEAMRTFNGHSAPVNAVTFSPDGEFVLTGSGDNTAKIWNRRTAEELLTLVVLEDNNWVVRAPSGLFDASPGAMNLLYFVINKEVIELEQLKERYYEPGLLAKIMGYSNDLLRSVAGFDSVALYPRITLRLDSVQHRLHIDLSPRHGGVGKISVFINDKEVIEDALGGEGVNRLRDTLLSIDLDSFARFFLMDTLNTVAVRAYNRENWLRSPLHTVTYSPDFVGSKGAENQPAEITPLRKKRNPALHLVLVGVADYAGKDLDLKYTAKDASDMASALRQAGGQLFSPDSVFVHVLTTDTGEKLPTKANIKATFESIAAKAKAEDILLAYFSGHGTNYGDAEKALFYFLTMEIGSFDLSDTGIRSARAISSDELTRWINLVPAQKQVLIVDACNSGKVAEDMMSAGGKSLTASQIRALDRMKDRTGMFILSGSAADQKSFESGGFRQSLLTYSLLEAMKTGTALTTEKDVDVMLLFQRARERVPVLAESVKRIQVPVPAFPKGGSTIFIGRVNEQVNIPLAPAGRVFIRSTFQDEDLFSDPLSLTDATDLCLLELDAEGAEFIFVDVKEYSNAYSVKGLYAIEGDNVTVRGRLFKGKEPVGALFVETGNKKELQILAKALVEKAVGEMR